MIRLRSLTSFAALLAGLAIPALGVEATASAAPGEWEAFHNEFSFVEEDSCGVPGLTLEQVFVVDGRSKVTVHGPDGMHYYAALEQVARTVTNVATGESVTQVIDLRFADLKVTDNGDGTSTIISQRPARVVYLQDGRVIARGATLVRFEALWDNGGTPTDPYDDEFLEEVIIKDVGNPADFCATVIQAVG
ncbi:hypothetical protein EKO23_00965 [Nocardioides guangzhouensis]|uniref:Uncharacterized protein n=1 Tax=Nocardioides guangzhouensis TaxID=2497878 RepID=A0A4Q4ZN21_9ACTN|nr:hypothetical protein [Nocardioides guangzhouensis]RYP89031.1 hypothetical protein EKO23_00965 [Nocardioides guangzhouensis]